MFKRRSHQVFVTGGVFFFLPKMEEESPNSSTYSDAYTTTLTVEKLLQSLLVELPWGLLVELQYTVRFTSGVTS